MKVVVACRQTCDVSDPQCGEPFDAAGFRGEKFLRQSQMVKTEMRGNKTAWIYSSLRGDEDFAEILPFFIDELPQKQALLSELASLNDMENLRREAHKLRGSAGGYGFQELSDLAGDLEESCQNIPLDEAAILRNLNDLLDHLRRVRT